MKQEDTSYVSVTDARWKTRQTIEISSASFDPDMQYIGSSPFLADTSRTGVVIPTGEIAGTCYQRDRYLARLCGIDIPEGSSVAIVGIRQYATIRALTKYHEVSGGDGCAVPFELSIQDPMWSFTDGNISWHIRYQPVNVPSSPAPLNASLLSTGPYSSTFYAINTSLPFFLPYKAPENGIPPGLAVGNFGTWRDLRFPWQNTNNQELRHIVAGPGSLVYYASVRQTNPFPIPTYTPLPIGFPAPGTIPYVRCKYSGSDFTDLGALRMEDRFVLQFPNTSQYGRVAGALMIELLPDFVPSTQS